MTDEMIYRDGVGYIPYHAHVRLMVVKDEQLTTLRAEVDRLSNANDQVWTDNERLRRFVERVAKLFDGKSLGKDARQALAEEKKDDL